MDLDIDKNTFHQRLMFLNYCFIFFILLVIVDSLLFFLGLLEPALLIGIGVIFVANLIALTCCPNCGKRCGTNAFFIFPIGICIHCGLRYFEKKYLFSQANTDKSNRQSQDL